MKTLFALFISLFIIAEAHARIFTSWDYDALNTKATLVVVATPTSVTKISEVTAFPNVALCHSDGSKGPIMGKGIETTFEILTVLKGKCVDKTLVLHHYEEVKKEPWSDLGLVSFEPKDKKRYLMFLQKEADGRYVAVSGQTDPNMSIKGLGSCP